MKRVEMKLIALALAASSVLSGCGIMGSASNEQTSASNEQNASAAENEGSTQAGENEITDLVLTHLASTEISTFNLLNSQAQRDVQYLTNMVDGLVEVDTNASQFRALPPIGAARTAARLGPSICAMMSLG